MSYPQQPYPAGLPPQGYQGYTGGYPGYPAPYPDPAVAYYPQPTYADYGGNGCFRCICTIMILSLLLTLTVSLIMFFVIKPDQGTFKVESLSVSDFNINPTSKVMSGKWDAKVSADNGRININKVESSLYQKETWLAGGSSKGLSSGFWHSHDWGFNSVSTMEYKFEVKNVAASVEEMEKEIKDNGGVTFNMRFNLQYVSTSTGFFWHFRSGNLKVTCKDLKIGLSAGANSGSLTDKPKTCEVSNG